MHEVIIYQFVVLWAVIDPVGSIPVYLAQARRIPKSLHKKVAKHAVLTAGGVLLFFLIAGQFLLDAMKIPLSAFQIAGGLVLLLFALTMIFGESKTDQELKMLKEADRSVAKELAVFPLAIPSIASPGAMLAMVMLTDNRRFSLSDQIVTGLITTIVLIITYILLRAASKIHRWIGDAGASIVSRVMGLILSAVAVDALLNGIKAFFVG